MPSSAHVYASAHKARKEKTHNKIHEPYNNPKHPPPLVKHPTTNIRDSNAAAKDESPTSRSSCSFIHNSREYLKKTYWQFGSEYFKSKNPSITPSAKCNSFVFCNGLRIRNQVPSRPETARLKQDLQSTRVAPASPLQLSAPPPHPLV